MDELFQLLIATLRADSALVRLLGVRTNDPRIYRYYEPEAIISDSQRAYITIALTANPERTGAVKEPVFTFAIWGKTWDVVEQVYTRVLALLDYTARPNESLTTTSGRQVRPVRAGSHDSAQENTKFAGRQLVIRFGESAV